MDLRLERPLGPAEDARHLLVRQAVDVPEDDRRSVERRQGGEKSRPLTGRIVTNRRVEGAAGRVALVNVAPRRVDGDEQEPPPPVVVPAQVDRDRCEPRPQSQLPDPHRFVRGERPIRTNERVLRDFLGVPRIAEQAQGDRVEAVLVGEHEALEVAIEIGREIGKQQSVHHFIKPLPLRIRCIRRTVRRRRCEGKRTRTRVRQSPAMRHDDRFDELIASLGGFHRTWLVYLGLELGFFRHLRDAAAAGMSAEELASAAGCQVEAVEVWAWAADAHQLATFDGGRLQLDEELAAILLDDTRSEFLGGQFTHAVVASLDWDRMAMFFRTGTPFRDRPDRYREAIERLTVQDVALFFQEALAALPQLVADLGRGGRVLDVHSGGGRWLIAMARRFPSLELVGVEFEADSVARARRNVEEAGLSGRVQIEHGDVTAPGHEGEFRLAYFQYALHALPDPPAALRAAWGSLEPEGWLLVLDWPLPSTVEEFRTRHGELIAGVQLDEVFQGTRLETRETFLGWFAAAGLPDAQLIDLPSGASLFFARKPV